jgi:protein TonB
LLVTILSQVGFLSLLRQPSTPAAVPVSVDVQLVALPATVIPPAPRPLPPAPPARRSAPRPKPRAETPIPRPETRVQAPPEPTPAPEAEPSTQASAPAVTVPAPAGPASPSATSRPSTQTPLAAVPPVHGPQGPPGGTETMSARALYKPMPEIPESLRHRTIDLVAVARFRVTADGSARVELTEPTSDSDLNRALLDALKRWRFFPATQAGKPVASTIDIRIPISVK